MGKKHSATHAPIFLDFFESFFPSEQSFIPEKKLAILRNGEEAPVVQYCKMCILAGKNSIRAPNIYHTYLRWLSKFRTATFCKQNTFFFAEATHFAILQPIYLFFSFSFFLFFLYGDGKKFFLISLRIYHPIISYLLKREKRAQPVFLLLFHLNYIWSSIWSFSPSKEVLAHPCGIVEKKHHFVCAYSYPW